MFNFKLAEEGWNNLKKIASDGFDGLVDVLTPSGGKIIGQVKAAGGAGPAPTIVKGAEIIPDVVPDVIPDSWSKYGKYVKYAAIGGAALLAYSVLKK